MAASFATAPSNDQAGIRKEVITFTGYTAGTLNGAAEHIFQLPRSGAQGLVAGNGWELIDVVLAVGVNTTHDMTTPLISATVEKNTDGGTTALATVPSLDNTAGTGRKTTRTAGTGIIPAVIHATQANRRFADDDVAFVTVLEAGSNGTDPSDVSVQLSFARIQDFDPLA